LPRFISKQLAELIETNDKIPAFIPQMESFFITEEKYNLSETCQENAHHFWQVNIYYFETLLLCVPHKKRQNNEVSTQTIFTFHISHLYYIGTWKPLLKFTSWMHFLIEKDKLLVSVDYMICVNRK